MYHPYLRGKLNELQVIRENAALLAQAEFVPIIEPVKAGMSGLTKALNAVRDAGGEAVVIVNPHHGEHGAHGLGISTLLTTDYADTGIMPGILLKDTTTAGHAAQCYGRHATGDVAFIHAGFTDAGGLIAALPAPTHAIKHVFLERKTSETYRSHFTGPDRVLIRDGFNKQKNASYPELELFSDLHLTYHTMGMTGFGDFLIVGDEFSESGGPAYAVALHLTFIDPARGESMMIRHFVSDERDTPTNPAGKFLEALDLMIARLNRPNSPILETRAVAEYRRLHAEQHFPGLGVPKKLSMQHHVETLAHYFS